MQYEVEKALIYGIAHRISVSDCCCNNVTTFSPDLIKPLWEQGLVEGPDLESLKTSKAGYDRLLNI